MRHFVGFLVVALFAAACYPQAILAATVTRDSDHQAGWSETDHLLRCNFRLSGPIGPGDAETLARLDDAWGDHTHAILCLDSPGGSFAEGIRLATLIRERALGTWIEPGKSCLSACSVAFMAGTENYPEVGDVPWRVLSSTGRLGFHAPALAVDMAPDTDLPSEVVASAYATAVAGLGELARVLMVAPRVDAKPHVQATLFAVILDTPPEEMMYVDTVGEAGMWDILVALPGQTHMHRSLRTAFAPPDPVTAVTLCANHLAWRAGARAADYSFQYRVEPSAEGLTITLGNMGMGPAVGCRLAIERDATIPAQGEITGDFGEMTSATFAAIGAHPATYPLAALRAAPSDRRVCYREAGGTEITSRPCWLTMRYGADRIEHVFSFEDGSTRTLTALLGTDDWAQLLLDGEMTGHQIRATPRGAAFCLGSGDADFCYRLPLD